MKLHIDFDRQSYRIRRYVIVCTIKDLKKQKIIYNSGLIYFRHYKSVIEFKRKVREGNPAIEIHTVDSSKIHKPDNLVGNGYWCPYCQSWEYWVTDTQGSRRCPICRISDSDYHVRTLNKLWTEGMKSKTTKQKMDRRRGVKQ